MTENETIKSLEYVKHIVGFPWQGEKWSANRETIAIDIAIKALEEIQQYREIGTVEEFREARERRQRKESIKGRVFKSLGYYQCPMCGGLLMHNEKFCSECGQAIDCSNQLRKFGEKGLVE